MWHSYFRSFYNLTQPFYYIFMNLSSLPIGSNFISVSCRSFLSKAAKTKNFIVLDVSYLVYM